MSQPYTALLETTRGATPECLHYGAIAVIDTQGRLVASVGNPHHLTFTRSTLKAIQALPFMQGGGMKTFGFQAEQVAMLCASHNGEPMHVTQTDTMLQKAGLTGRALRCGCHVPGIFTLLEQAPPVGLVFDERHNNCSGKHAGFLAYCVAHGHPIENYEEPQHPLQQAIRQKVAAAARMDTQDLKIGIDGCSAPNYAMPLSKLALCYARLANGYQDPDFGDCFGPLSEAMIAHPELVSGTGRSDLAFTQAGRGDWVCKIGADGVQVIGSKSRGQALAIKVADGSKVALYAITVAVLDQLGWLDASQKEALEPWRASVIKNANGWNVGHRAACFELQSHQ